MTQTNEPAIVQVEADLDTAEKQYVSSWFRPRVMETASGDLILLLTSDYKRYLIKLTPHQNLHTHQGIYEHDDLIGQRLGTTIQSQMGHEALMLEPSLDDLIKHLRRGTQIIYPKDAAYIVHRLGIRSGSHVIEAGTGSGGLTTALAWAAAPTGCIYTYETRADNHRLARKNLERVALLPYVQMFQQSIEDGFHQKDVDALFLDVREPWRFLGQARAALRSGGFFGSLVPTTNQVSQLLTALEEQGVADITVQELLLRKYKPVPQRLRPDEEMVAHTGYMIFARMIDTELDPSRWLSKERQRYQARLKTTAR